MTTAGIIAVIVALALAAWGVSSRIEGHDALRKKTAAESIPTVAVVEPTQEARPEELTLPGSLQAYTDAPVYARVSGYLKSRFVDIGSRVKAGDLLAEIDTPEIDEQLRQAEADLATAEANNQLAQITARRWRGLVLKNSVSEQDTDEKVGDAAAKQAALVAARANLARLRDLQGFKRITAPFDGVITARNVDIGTLIDAGGGAHELFHLAATQKLRLYVQAPQVYAAAMVPGISADVQVVDRPGRDFTGRLVRTAGAIDPASRTLLVELEVGNPEGELLPGAYAEVRFKLPPRPGVLRLPANALLFRAGGLKVAAVTANGRVELLPITLGRDFGTEVEVLSGLAGNQPVIINPPDSIASGQAVRVAGGTAGEGAVK